MTAPITSLQALAERLTAKRDELAADLDGARAVLDAEPIASYPEESATRRAAVALAHDAATGGDTLAGVKDEINRERDAVARAIAADQKSRDAARKAIPRREADLVEVEAQLAEVDRLIRGEVAQAGKALLAQSEAAFRNAIAAVVDAAARRTAALALANDDSSIESARSVGRFTLSLPTMGLSVHDIEGAHHVGSGELRVDREASGRLAGRVYAELRAAILAGEVTP
jgi:hypothetical protein